MLNRGQQQEKTEANSSFEQAPAFCLLRLVSAEEALEQVARDALHPLVRTVGAAVVRDRRHVARRLRQSLRPEDR